MKRVYSAIGLCAALLIFEALVFLPSTNAKEDVVSGLLQLPAPPPPNPLARRHAGSKRASEFFDQSKPPSDDASIDDLVEYWAAIQRQRSTLTYSPEPSERTLDRLFKEIDKDPTKLVKLIGSFPDGEKTADFVKNVFDREGTTGVFSKDERKLIKDWLIYHSPAFSDELLRLAQKAGDTDTYVTNQDELLALTRTDFSKAKPLIDKLYANASDKASRVLAKWALYRHAVDSDSLSDIERYRDELKAVVEDKTLGGPTRDLAMDALVSEKEWPGRDEWYMSLLSDPTLADLNGYTGLTTLINISPAEKYVDKMIQLLGSSDKAVRTAAVRNLLLRGNQSKPEVVRAMLPWLEDPHWANDIAAAREGILNALRTVKIPESVPGLIKMLDEKKKQTAYAANNPAANMPMSNRPAANVAGPGRFPANAAAANAPAMIEVEAYAFRSSAIGALAFQADPSAGPALRRVLNEMEGYERVSAIEAILKCSGFSVGEQVDALETAARRQFANQERMNAAANAAATGANTLSESPYQNDNTPMYKPGPLSQSDIKQLLGERLLVTSEVSDELVYGLISRLESLDKRDQNTAHVLRITALRWPNVSVNVLFLRDLKADRADLPSVVRLLAMRRVIKTQLSTDMFDARTGSPTANGIVACMVEDPNDYDAILAAENAEAKTAMLACARMIRASLPAGKVAEFVKSGDRRLALAAERYLEAEDSPAARAVVLGLHPGEARILGASTAFFTDDERTIATGVQQLFTSVGSDGTDGFGGESQPIYLPEGEQLGPGDEEGRWGAEPAKEDLVKTEKALRDEVRKDADLLGVYAYDRQYVRIYNGRVMFSWDDDESRYRERQLSTNEFDTLKAYLSDRQVDLLPPFLACEADTCTEHELLMLGRSGGRRVYTDGGTYEFFTGLEKILAEFKLPESVIKYALSREIPDLAILLANDNLEVQTVWKDGNDMRAAVSDKAARKRADDEIDKAVEKVEESGVETPEGAEMSPSEALRVSLTKKREYDGLAWHSVVGGSDGGTVAQPPGFDLIPVHDGTAIQPTREQWKARAGSFDLRASEDGLFKFAGGKLTSIAKGNYSDPIITSGGKWAVVHTSPNGEPDDSTLIRINLLTNKAYPVKVEGYIDYLPKAYIASINRVLLVPNLAVNYEGMDIAARLSPTTDTVGADPDPSTMMLLDPDTGTVSEIVGEMGPIAQQTFRPLQRAAKANEFWAAIPDLEGKSTRIGIYNTNNFGFEQRIKIPKIIFNSMSMWVDEAGGKLYFVYRGHLLSLPLSKK